MPKICVIWWPSHHWYSVFFIDNMLLTFWIMVSRCLAQKRWSTIYEMLKICVIWWPSHHWFGNSGWCHRLAVFSLQVNLGAWAVIILLRTIYQQHTDVATACEIIDKPRQWWVGLSDWWLAVFGLKINIGAWVRHFHTEVVTVVCWKGDVWVSSKLAEGLTTTPKELIEAEKHY